MVHFTDIFDLPFFLDRSEDSILRRYIEAHKEEMDSFGERLEDVIESHQIDNAEDEELDRIGESFGILGQRRGRDDQDYRIYLKSLVQSFKGRGTVPGIISAVAAGLNTDESDISVTEDFQNLEYVIELEDWSPHRGSTVEELSELADASVSDLKRTEYKIDDEEMSVSDDISIFISTRASDDEIGISDIALVNENKITTTENTGISDTAVARRRGVTDETSIEDVVFIDNNKLVISESAFVADAVSINTNKFSESDAAAVTDAVSTSTTTVTWDTGNWDEMDWATEHE